MLTTGAIVNFVFWLAGILYLGTGLKEDLLLFGAMVAAPLAIDVSKPADAQGILRQLSGVIRKLHLPASLLLLLAFARPAGDLAAALSIPWLLFTSLVALTGFIRLVRRRFWPVAEFAIDCGWIYFAIGGVWTLVSRRGKPFLGFVDPIAFLTAAHFHFAGLVLPILTGLAAREIRTRFAAGTSVGVVAAVPALAAGITLTQQQGIVWAEPAAAGAMVLAVLSAALVQAQLGWSDLGKTGGALWIVSSASLLAGAGLAAIYATSQALGKNWLDIPRMVEVHATTMAFGYALMGLLGWAIRPRRQ